MRRGYERLGTVSCADCVSCVGGNSCPSAIKGENDSSKIITYARIVKSFLRGTDGSIGDILNERLVIHMQNRRLYKDNFNTLSISKAIFTCDGASF